MIFLSKLPFLELLVFFYPVDFFSITQVDESELEAELDALGDDFALDEDSSYLDDAIAAPSAPTGVPGADSVTNKVQPFHV